MMDYGKDFLVGDEFWDLLGGKNTFKDLLETFESVGKKYKEKLDVKFKKIASEKIDSYWKQRIPDSLADSIQIMQEFNKNIWGILFGKAAEIE